MKFLYILKNLGVINSQNKWRNSNWKEWQISRLMEFTTYQTTHATSTIFEICERAQTAALVGSLKSTQLPIVYRITRAGRIPLFHSVRISYQQGRGRSTIAHREKISVPNSVVASLDIWRYYQFVWVLARYIVDISPSFFFSPRRNFASRHGKRM